MGKKITLKDEVIQAIRDKNPSGLRYFKRWLSSTRALSLDDPIVYRLVRRHTGVTVDEWADLIGRVR